MYRRCETGSEALALDWDALALDAPAGGASAFDAGGYSGTLLGSMQPSGGGGWAAPSAPVHPPAQGPSPGQGGGGSDDALFGMLGKAFGMLGNAIPSIAGDAAKAERAEALRLERERLAAAKQLGYFPGVSGSAGLPQGGYAAAAVGSQPAAGGMSTGTMIALGVGAAGLVVLLWPKKKTSQGEGEA